MVIYSSDHGLTLGEHGIVGKHGSRAQWHIYHVPFMIRHPEGKLAGQWDDYFASNHDIRDGALVHGRPGAGDDGRRGPVGHLRRQAARRAPALHLLLRRPRPRGRLRLVPHLRQRGRRKRLYDKQNDPQELVDVADQHPELVDKYWRILEDEAGGTLPQFAAAARRR